MFWLILIIITGSYKGGAAMVPLEKYQYIDQCKYAGESFIATKPDEKFPNYKEYAYACVPAAVNGKQAP